ncbi:MAG TPA: acetyl-CoA C-acyltransferase, partial [Verrucomicrobiota bacterium]|nr:acetyl-CoA C-acyltransferase [Verrucomicrobiota bacterium]
EGNQASALFGYSADSAGEDNRNIARMAGLLAGLPETVPGCTVNRLCGSGLEAVAMAARIIGCGEAGLIIAGGVESMSRAPFVMAKSPEAFSRQAEVFDTTIGWRFVNRRMRERYGVETMAETAENLTVEFGISREDQDRFAAWSQAKAAAAQADGRLAGEIVPIAVPQRKGDPVLVAHDEHPRPTTLEKLAQLKPIVRPTGTVTAGNASGINDGAAALIVASRAAAQKHGLTPRVRVLGAAVAGVPPRVMGTGPVPATGKLLRRLGLKLDQFDLIELNEAFAVQALVCARQLHLADDDARLNPQGGAIALGHPLGMSGARLVVTATHQLHRSQSRRALCTMCVGVGQGIALALERCD